MAVNRIRTTAFSTLFLGSLGASTAIWAQSASETGGVQLRFGLGLRVETQTNGSLRTNSSSSSWETATDLSFGVLSETRAQKLSFDAKGTLRYLDSDRRFTDNGFVRPSLALKYDRQSASARFGFSATLREIDLERPDTLFFDGTEVIPVSGDATRRSSAIQAKVDWRDDAPLGFGLLARIDNTSYSGGPVRTLDGTLITGNKRLTLTGTSRMDLNKATQLNISLSHSRNETGGSSRDTLSLYNTLKLQRPLGDINLTLGLTDTESGSRTEIAVGRDYETPLGVLSGSIGATRSASGRTTLTGQFNATQALPQGNLSFGLSRKVTSGSEQDIERLSTQIDLGYLQQVSPLSNFKVDLKWAEVDETVSGLDAVNATLGATYSRNLTPDWDLAVGYRHNYRDDTRGSASSNELFLKLSREFVTRF